jgi:calcium-dependent protein kinase
MQAVLTYIMTNIIQHKETKDLEQAFKRLDTNQDGKLSKEELTEGFKQSYPQYDELQIRCMVDKVLENADSNMSGEIDYTEYLVSAISKQTLLGKDKLQKAFLSFDLVGVCYVEWRWLDQQGRVGKLLRRSENH